MSETFNLKLVKTESKVDVSSLPSKIDGRDVCQICFGTGMEIVNGKGARSCGGCRQGKSALLSSLEKARVPDRYLKCDFSNYSLLSPGTGDFNPYAERARDKALEFVQKYPYVDRGLLFMGPVGVGKTHLATSIIKGLIDRNFTSCLFYEFGWLLKEIQDSYNPNTQMSEMQLLSRIIEIDVLVLDEIGASKPTDWVKDTLMNIISTRYNKQKVTIFTTNYLDEEYILTRHIDREYVEKAMLRREGNRGNIESIRKWFDTLTIPEQEEEIRKEKRNLLVSKETFQDRIGVRLRSRLYEMCDDVYIDGSDFRRKGRKGSRVSKK